MGKLGSKLDDALEAGVSWYIHIQACTTPSLSLVKNMILGTGGSKSSEVGVSFELLLLLFVTHYPIRICLQPMQRLPVLYSGCQLLYLRNEW